MRRLAQAMGAAGSAVTELCSEGWSPTKENLNAAADRLAELGTRRGDLVILDLWSNSACMGTDDMGLPTKPVRSKDDGRFHIVGAMQAAPPQCLNGSYGIPYQSWMQLAGLRWYGTCCTIP